MSECDGALAGQGIQWQEFRPSLAVVLLAVIRGVCLSQSPVHSFSVETSRPCTSHAFVYEEGVDYSNYTLSCLAGFYRVTRLRDTYMF